jgi:uncharacterized membrane protein
MMDQATRDDAPAATSKDSAETTGAAHALAAGRGDTVIGRSVTIARPAQEVYAFFRDFSNLPRFMENIERIEVQDDRRSHWVVKAPAGGTVEWDAVVTEDQPGTLLAWQTEEGAEVPNGGRVEFKDVGERGTVVSATIVYDPPGGTIGKLIAKMFQREPGIQARRDLARLKQYLETGEVATGAHTQAERTKREG